MCVCARPCNCPLHMHSLNIVHGDLKPDNVMLKDGVVKIGMLCMCVRVSVFVCVSRVCICVSARPRICPLLKSVKHVHSLNIVHGDLKPDNALLKGRGGQDRYVVCVCVRMCVCVCV